MYVKEYTGKYQPGVERRLFLDGDTIIVHRDANGQEKDDVWREVQADGFALRYCRADGHWWDVYEVYGTPKTAKARLDTDRTAKPKTHFVGRVNPGHCFNPETVTPVALENTETGERTSLEPRFVAPATQLATVLDALIGHLNKVGPVPQAQNSLTEQLQALVPVANKLGLYDAADYLTTVIQKAERA